MRLSAGRLLTKALVLYLLLLAVKLSAESNCDVFDPGVARSVGEMTYVDIAGKSVKYYQTTRSIEMMKDEAGKPFKDLLEKIRAQRLSVLDAGSSLGYLVEDFRKENIDAVGVDIWLADELKKRSYFHLADIRKMDFPTHSFDVSICAFNVFHYGTSAEYRAEALQELIRVTRVGGEILLVGVAGLPNIHSAGLASLNPSHINQYVSSLMQQFGDSLELVETHDGEGRTLRFRRK